MKIRTRKTILFAIAPIVFGSQGHAQAFAEQMARWQLATNQLVSALKVETRQTALGAEQVSNSYYGSQKALATSVVQTETAYATLDAVNASNDALTSGGELCQTTEVAKLTGEATELHGNFVDLINQSDVLWMENGGNLSDRLSAGLVKRSEVYCSEAEFIAGICGGSGGVSTAAGSPAGDSNAGNFLLNPSYGTETALTGADYIDNIAPLPTVPKSSIFVDQTAKRIEATRDSAIVGVVRQSMADIIGRGLEGEN